MNAFNHNQLTEIIETIDNNPNTREELIVDTFSDESYETLSQMKEMHSSKIKFLTKL